VNVTIIGGNAGGFLTLGPSDQIRPATSSTGSVQFILDLNGYFQ
jgi:hypothetical protein